MTLRLADIVQALMDKAPAQLLGDADILIERLAPLETAGPQELTFLSHARFLGQLAQSAAACVVGWLFALGWRSKRGAKLDDSRFNVAQLGLALLTQVGRNGRVFVGPLGTKGQKIIEIRILGRIRDPFFKESPDLFGEKGVCAMV